MHQRYIWLGFLTSVIIAFVLSFGPFDPKQSLQVVRYGGYWIIAISFGLFCYALVPVVKDVWFETTGKFRWGVFCGIFALGLVLFVQEPWGYKVLMDELNLIATSLAMHLDREVILPVGSNRVSGEFFLMGDLVDKRPIFFPFLLSIFHDLTGYRPANALVLNGLLSFCLIGLLYVLGKGISQCRKGGIMVILMIVSLPLVALNATGAGFELLNLVLILLSMLLSVRYLERRDDSTMNALVLTVVLLAHTRYESILYVLAVGAVILIGWVYERRMRLTWSFLFAPVLLVLRLLQRNSFEVSEELWVLRDRDTPFSLSYINGNLESAFSYFFSVDRYQTNSIIVSLIGCVSVIFLLVFIVKRWRSVFRLRPDIVVLLVFGIVVVGNFFILMAYHWGQLDDFMVSRLSLPLLAMAILSVAFVYSELGNRFFLKRLLVVVPLVGLVAFTLPNSAKHAATQANYAYKETEWFMDFIRKHKGENALYVMPSALPAIVLEEPSVANIVLNGREESLQFHMREKTYESVYVFQRLARDPQSGEKMPYDKHSVISSRFVLEPTAERMFKPLYFSRISQLERIDPKDGEEQELSESTTQNKEIVDEDKAEALYMKKYLEMLP
jgi:hypothetical protein